MKIVKYKKLSQSCIFLWLQLMYGANLDQLKKNIFSKQQANYELMLVVIINKNVIL